MKKRSGVVYIFAAVLLIVVGVVTTSIIGAVKNDGQTTDIRAKAGATNTLKLTGIVSEITPEGTITVTDVQFAPESRSGPAKNYGTWSVTPPLSFNPSQAAPGMTLTFTVETTSFNVASKKVAAVQMSVQ